MNDKYCISRETFQRVINNITAYEQVPLNAIEYVTSTLVNEVFEVLVQDIVRRIIPSINQDHASNMILSDKYFLKHWYTSHNLRNDGDICYHGGTYGLSKHVEAKSNTQCSGCKYIFYVCDQQKKICTASIYEAKLGNDVVEVVQDIAYKFKLYVAFTGGYIKVMFSMNIFENTFKPNEEAQGEIIVFINGSTMVQ